MPPFSGQRPSFRPRSHWQKPSVVEKLPGDRNIMEGIATQKIDTPEDDPYADRVEIEDCMYIGSYNWLERATPTILVPGSPPQWLDKEMPYHVPVDRGVFCSDRNGLNVPDMILLPLILAVNKTMEYKNLPQFDWPSVDFVMDRNVLMKLARWASKNTHDFRVDLQMAGDKTVLVNRFPLKVLEEAPGFTSRHNFEKQATKPFAGCLEHYRVVSFDLNGWKMVVRFEVDAYVEGEGDPFKEIAPSVDRVEEEIALHLDSLSHHAEGQGPTVVNVHKGGREIPASALVELTTRSVTGYDPKWKDRYAQLFFSESTFHFLALHDRGNYSTVEKRSMAAPEFEGVKEDIQSDVKKLVKVLEHIRDLVIENGKEGRLSLVCIDGVLNVYKRGRDESCLPSSVLQLFESKMQR